MTYKSLCINILYFLDSIGSAQRPLNPLLLFPPVEVAVVTSLRFSIPLMSTEILFGTSPFLTGAELYITLPSPITLKVIDPSSDPNELSSIPIIALNLLKRPCILNSDSELPKDLMLFS